MHRRSWWWLGLAAPAGAALLWIFQPWSGQGRPFLSFLGDSVAADVQRVAESDVPGLRVDTAVDGLKLPWDIAFLDERQLLVTEKAGRLLRVDLDSGQRSTIAGVPKVTVHGQGGLHAVRLHPQFDENRWVYLSYADASPDGGYTTHVARGRLEGDRLVDVQMLLRANAATSRGQHFGGAMAFDGKGYLFLSVGDRGARDDAQNLGRHNGKILRLHDDGRAPADNPFVDQAGALPEIWSYGHRNPQGLDFDPASGRLWAVEHGPRGGDELNQVQRGRNYGWPVITYGKEYVGGSIGEGTAKAGMEQPVHYYVPSIATAGMAFYAGEPFPEWRNSVFIAALRGHLNRVQLGEDGSGFAAEARLLADRGLRLRGVRVSPAGELWLIADDGVLLRLWRET